MRVEVRRGSEVESLHRVQGAVVDSEGTVVAATEGAETVTYFRSAAKPFQLVPLVERGHADRFGLGDRELAVMSASHNGEPVHVACVRGILERIGAEVSDLECGYHEPHDPGEAARLRDAPEGERTAIYNNCSGKHAGMIALARAEGWPIEGYTDAGHPVQRLLIETMAEICGVDASRSSVAIDGCSAATPALSLVAMARGYARFAVARDSGATLRERALARIRRAMALHPDLVAGRGRLCTFLMRAVSGRLVTKTGAEAVQCVAVPERGWGMAIKVEDGTRRAVGPALVGWLHALGLLDDGERAGLAEFGDPILKNHRGIAVGMLAAQEFPSLRQLSRPVPSGGTRA